MKKIIALVLAILMLLPMIASCSNDIEDDTGSEASTEEGDGLLLSDKVRDVKFNGEDINIWQVTVATNAAEYFYDMNGDMAGDVISYEIFKRNAEVEAYLNVNINFIDGGSESSNAATDCRPLLQSGSEEFDAYELIQWNGMGLVTEGWFKNLDDSNYLDFEGEWWSEDFMDAAKINGRNYVMAGDVGIDMVSCAASIFVNKDMLSKFHGEDAYENLRTMVLNGEWTIEEMTKLAKGTYDDLNRNDVVDIEDQFGFLSSQNHIDGWYFGAGGTTIVRNNEGKAVLSMGDEHTVDIMERLYRVMHVESPNDYGNNAGTTQIYNSKHQSTLVEKFSKGEMMFCIGYLYTSRNLTNMEDEFAPIPYPKYNTDQEEYHSILHNIVTLFAIPTSCLKYDQTSATFEVMASFGKQNIVPFYYETMLKIRYLDNVEDTKLVDLIYNARMSDIGVIFNTKAFSIPRKMIQEKSINMSRYLASFQNEIQTDLNTINGFNLPE